MTPEIRKMIDVYLAVGAEAIRDLQQSFPLLKNMFDRRKLGIPREGTLPSGRTYSFHGIGCRFELNETTVDIDFGIGGETNGFDAWRLYACWKSLGNATDLSLEEVKSGLDEMRADGQLSQQNDRSLYFLAGR